MDDRDELKKKSRRIQIEVSDILKEHKERIRFKFALQEKITLGEKLSRDFSKFIKKKFPLAIFGRDELQEILYKKKSQYYFNQTNLDLVDNPTDDSVMYFKEEISDSIHAIICLKELVQYVDFIKYENEWNSLVLRLNMIELLEEKIEFLLESKYSAKAYPPEKKGYFTREINYKLEEIEALQKFEKILASVSQLGEKEDKLRCLVEKRHIIKSERYKHKDILIRKIDVEIEIINNLTPSYPEIKFLRVNNQGETNKTDIAILIQIIYLLKFFGKNGKHLKRKELIDFFEKLLDIKLPSFDKLVKQGLTSYRSQKDYIGNEICDISQNLWKEKQSST